MSDNERLALSMLGALEQENERLRARVDELLEANNAEVEKRRKLESSSLDLAIRRVLPALIEAVDGSDDKLAKLRATALHFVSVVVVQNNELRKKLSDWEDNMLECGHPVALFSYPTSEEDGNGCLVCYANEKLKSESYQRGAESMKNRCLEIVRGVWSGDIYDEISELPIAGELK